MLAVDEEIAGLTSQTVFQCYDDERQLGSSLYCYDMVMISNHLMSDMAASSVWSLEFSFSSLGS